MDEFSGPHLWGDESMTSLLVLLSSRYMYHDRLVFWTECSSAQGRGVKGKEAVQLLNIRLPTILHTVIMLLHISHLNRKQRWEGNIQVHSNNDISNWDQNLTSNAHIETSVKQEQSFMQKIKS